MYKEWREIPVLNEFLATADGWISERTSEPGITWFRGAIKDVANASTERPLSVAIGLAPRRLGKADLAADPWVPTSMATVLTMIKFMNAVGADKLTPQAIADQAKAFKGPLVFGAPQVQCAKYPDAPAVCNDQTQFFNYAGKGQFKRASGFVRPPE